MKTIIIMTIFCFFWISIIAQTPQAFKYQAVARNTSGEILSNQLVSFRISIMKGSVTGAIVYTETHKKTTSAFGLVDLEIGRGTPVSGVFSNITWGNDAYFINMEIDPSGGTAYQFLGASQLLSVPYALSAKDVLNKDDADADPTNELQKISISGTVLTLDKNGGSVTLPSSGTGGDNWGTQAVVTDATLAGTGTPSSPMKIAQQSAASGQVLKWNGSTWTPGNDQSGGLVIPFTDTKATNGTSFEIINSSTTSQPDGIAISGKTQHIAGYGIWGESMSTTGGGVGVFGTTANPNGFSGYFSGGKFHVQGNVGIGIVNPGAKLDVAGQVKITGGSPGAGKVLTSDASGLASWQTPVGGLTLPYSGSISNDYDAFKIYNSATNPETPCAGIHGISASRVGVWGETTSGSGAGVYGLANATSGTAYGVFGQVSSSSSYSGYFLGGRFYVSGNVGIGVLEPSTKLEVAGRVKITAGNPGVGKVLTSDANGLATWETPGLILPFDGTVASDFPVIKVSNTGIGNGLLAISNSSTGSRFGITGASYSSSGAGVIGTSYSTIGTTYGITGKVHSSTGYSGYFEGGRFYAEGNVGIGVLEPAYKLDVSGNRIRLINDTEWIALRTDGNTGFLDLSYSGGKLVIQGSATDENIILNPAMNKVGIRTWAPQYELDVNGSIRAIGSVYYGGSTTGTGTAYTKPDFVFNDNYKVFQTEEVEAYVKIENHLPWITSAEQEKKENGTVTDMTRMSFETLEAVENLQLQVIQQDKVIRELKAHLEKLESLVGGRANK